MTSSRRHRRFTTRASAVVGALVWGLAAWGQGPQAPLPIYLEDNHAGTFQFLATTLDLEQPHVLVLVDAHADSSLPQGLPALRTGLRRVGTPDERDRRIRSWRRSGSVQAFDWIAPLMPSPIARVVWVRPERTGGAPAAKPGDLPPGFTIADGSDIAARLPAGWPVVASIDLDSFTGLPPADQEARFGECWARVVGLPRLAAVSLAISRPWLADDAEASRLVLLALRSAPGLAAMPEHQRQVAEALAEARAKAQSVIVLPHWGREGSARITDEQRQWARWFVEQGADAVVGSGPHIVQAYEAIDGAPVYYSAGNLWFQGPWPAESRHAGVALLGLDAAGRIVTTRMDRVTDPGGDGRAHAAPAR